uniref:Uncharacterized protein n=1 Tax=Arundo donax TaxID=35708 RepID=A0A0A8ZY02_ARUDO
MKYNRSAMF